MRGAANKNQIYSYETKFLLTRLMRGAAQLVELVLVIPDFYSRASCEARLEVCQ